MRQTQALRTLLVSLALFVVTEGIRADASGIARYQGKPHGVSLLQERSDTSDSLNSGPSAIRLETSLGGGGATELKRAGTVAGEALGAEMAAKILGRLPEPELSELPAELPTADEKLGPTTLHPPKSGDWDELPLPTVNPKPEAAPTPLNPRPLEVVRSQPEGDVTTVHQVSITFSAPMVALGSDESRERELEKFPIKISPAVPGARARWLSPRTLVVKVGDRFPMATRYTVTVPAGTRSAEGGVLSKEYIKHFTTDAPRLVSANPEPDAKEVEAFRPFVLQFNQRVDPRKLLESVSLEGGGKSIDLRLASDEAARQLLGSGLHGDAWSAGRALVFETTSPLKWDTDYSLRIPAGTRLAEGPIGFKTPVDIRFRTISPFKVTDFSHEDRLLPLVQPEWEKARPGTPIWISFNHEIDVSKFKPEWITIDPRPVEGSTQIKASGSMVTISGFLKPGTKYKIHISDKIRDIYGQRLADESTYATTIHPSTPQLVTPPDEVILLSARAEPMLPMLMMNIERVEVEIRAVDPWDYPTFNEWRMSLYKPGVIASEPPGKLVWNKVFENAEEEKIELEKISLEPAFQAGFGTALVIVKMPRGGSDGPKRDIERRFFWVHKPEILGEFFSHGSEHTVMVATTKDGQPVADAELVLQPDGKKFKTDGSGFARFHGLFEPSRVRREKDQPTYPWMEIRKGTAKDALFFDRISWRFNLTREIHQKVRVWASTDRSLYRPGEQVHVHGWVRLLEEDLDSAPVLPGKGKGHWFLKDSRGVELARGEFNPNQASSRFALEVTIPKGANLGEARMELQMAGGSESLGLGIQEFRKPEFEANISVERPEYQLGEEAIFTLSSRLFGGGSPIGLPVEWSVAATPMPFHSAEWSDFHFGQGENDKATQLVKRESVKVETDSKGQVSYRVRFEESTRSSPWTIQVSARVQDLNRQSRQFRSQTTLIGRDRALGLELSPASLRAGASPRVSLVVVDPTAAKHPAIAGESVKLELWKVPNRHWFRGGLISDRMNSSELVETLEIKSGSNPVAAAFKSRLKGGSYEIRGRMPDSEGRRVETFSDFTIWGQDTWRVESEYKSSLQLKWKEGVGPQGGEVGKKLVLQVESALGQAQGTAMIRSVARGDSSRFELKDGRAELTILPDSRDNTGLSVEIALVNPVDGREEKGVISIGISRPERKLSLEVKPSESRPLPGSQVRVKVLAKDHQGKPAEGADIWVFAVDDALLSLRAHDPGTPESSLWSRNAPRRAEIERRNSLSEFDIDAILKTLESMNEPRLAFNAAVPTLGAMPEMEMAKPSRGMEGSTAKKDKGAGREEEDSSPIAVRKDFRSLAFYETKLTSDSQGKVEFTAKLPDSTTRYTVFAVALDLKGRSGSRRVPLQTGLPFYLRPSLPRFLSLGDQAELSVLVQNQTDESREAQVVARAWGLELSGEVARKIRIPGGETREVRFPVRVNRVGKALIQVGLLDPKTKLTDAVQQGFPLYLPATIEAYAQSGSLTDRAVTQPLVYPSDAEPGIGGLDITLSSTRLQSLKDVWVGLDQYPFECNEQLASKLLAVAAMKPVLKAFLGKKSAEEAEARIPEYITLLKNRIRADGSFDFWGKSERGDPFITVHVAHGLVRAQKAGIPVPKELLDRNLARVRTLREWMEELKWDPGTQDALEAYALRVRQLGGESLEGRAFEIYQRSKERTRDKGHADLELLGHLLPILNKGGRFSSATEEILRIVNNRIEETDGRAHLITRASDAARVLLHSNRRTEAVVLEALVEARPQLDFLPKLVEGILGSRTQGRWRASTQESVFALLAVGKYFEVLEKSEPKFKARVWLDGSLKAERKFEGREFVNAQAKVSLSALKGVGKRQLILEKQGTGRMYYRIGLSFAPKGMDFAPEDRGFEVSRVYEAIDDPKDVVIDGNGDWHIKAGARLRIRTRVFSQVQHDHVALVESFPAGFEPEDIVEPWKRGWSCLWWGNWYDHSQLRDQRSEAFAEHLSPGEHEIVTVVRATGIGKFTAPPARAEEMYNPDVFGRSRSETVWIDE